MRTKQKACFLIAGIGMLWLLTNCARKPVAEAGLIRYEIDRQPYRVVNHAPDRIEVLEPDQSYYKDKEGWSQVICKWACFGLPDEFFTIGKFVNSGSEFVDDRQPGVETCAPNSKCDIFASRRYRIPRLPGRMFVVYSNEGQPSDPSLVQEGTLSISILSSDPFHFTLYNASDEGFGLCWTRTNKKQEVGWGEDSRLERRTEYGTWEIISHTLDLCADGVNAEIKIPASKSVSIDGTKAYPGYTQLPSGVYRWVIILNQQLAYNTLLFSPRFQWSNQQ